MTHVIMDNCIGCTACATVCPQDCIFGDKEELHVIHEDWCIDCSVCGNVCPVAAIIDWKQDLVEDSSGKSLYLRDAASGKLWSLSPAPVWAALDRYECRHGLGYSTFVTEFAGVHAEWTLFCHVRETVEFWIVELCNLTRRARTENAAAFCSATNAARTSSASADKP